MFLTKKHLSRRTVLKGAGAAIALPLLDAMIPARHGAGRIPPQRSSRASASSTSRTARCRSSGRPEGTGKDFKFSPILKPLEGMRDYVTVVTNLRNKPGESTDPHGIIEADLAHLPRCRNSRRARPGTPASPSTRWPRARSARTRRCPRIELCGEPGGACQLPQPRPGPAAGRQPAPGVHDHVRPRRFQRRAQGPAAVHRQPARLRAGVQQEPQPQAGRAPTARWSATTWSRCARSKGACRS